MNHIYFIFVKNTALQERSISHRSLFVLLLSVIQKCCHREVQKKNEGTDSKPEPSNFTPDLVTLYYVRIHDVNEKLDIQATFIDQIKFPFKTEHQLDYCNTCSPLIYTLTLPVKIDNNERLSVYYKNAWKDIENGQYGLEISHKKAFATSFTYQEKGETKRPLADGIKDKHYFLFDMHFSSSFGTHLPGLDPNRYISLCLYTYFLVRADQHDTFNILVKQFQNMFSDKKYLPTNSDFIDFFQTCDRYFKDSLTKSDKKMRVLKIILQMIGLFQIDKTNFAQNNQYSNAFASHVMAEVRNNWNELFKHIDNTDYTLFKRGLTTLLSIELLQNITNDNGNNKVYFLSKIDNKKHREDLSYKLLLKLFQLEKIIPGDISWTDLFSIVNPETIVINHLELTNSFRTMVSCILKISKAVSNDNVFESQITNFFEHQVSNGRLQVDIQSILYLMNTILDQEAPEEPILTKQYISTFQSAVKNSVALKQKIKEYFNDLKMKLENMEDIRTIINSIDKYPLLTYLDKYEYLKKSLKDLSTADEYVKWFQCFLAKIRISNDKEQKLHKVLMNSWIHAMEIDYIEAKKILFKIDALLDSFDQADDKNEFCVYCINCIIDLCFRQSSIYFLIGDGLLYVQNELFRHAFRIRFFEKYLSGEEQSVMRDINNKKNPFLELIKLDKGVNGKSLLVRDLIKLTCSQIESPNDNELLELTFFNPIKPSLIFTILFEDAFEDLQIRREIIQGLTNIWDKWEINGFQLDQINKWAELKAPKREYACEIWNFIGEYNKKPIRIEQWIGEAERKIKEISELKDAIIKCLNNHCQNAPDKNRYLSHLNNLEQQINAATVSSAKVHPDIELLQPYTEYLNPIFDSHVWTYYLKKSVETKKHDDTEEKTCLKILKETAEIRVQFINRLVDLCTDTKQALHPQLEQLFSEKNLIEFELNILKPLLPNDIAAQLEILLNYWKDRDRILNIWKGYKHIIDEYHLPTSEKLNILESITNTDSQTLKETCVQIYQDYCTYFSKQYSESILQLIVQWSLSYELLTYVNSLGTSDVDDLLEVVNDWDESLINTKTILDFVLLKRFLDKVNTEINTVKQTKSLQLDDVINASEKILQQNEFQNLLNNIEACLKNLPSIQRISTGSTNREQSKRKRILDIINKSDFCFCVHQVKGLIHAIEYQFDIHIKNNDWEPVSFDELSDLRDRARLIQYASGNSNNVQNYTETDIQKLQLFVSLVDTIEMILQTLTALYIAGYPVMKQYPMSKRKFSCSDGNHNELVKFKEILTKQLDDWETELCAKYKECINLTYFSYQQLSMIENALHNETATKPYNSIYHLLKFVGVNPQTIQINLLPNKSKTPSELLNFIAKIVQTKRDRSYSLTQEEKDDNNKQVQEKISVVETKDPGILRAILSLFNLYKITVPVANQLFYCTTNTNWIEVRAFIYRCFYSQTLHQLIQPELLSIVIQDQFVQLLNRLMDQYPNRMFRLGIITTVSSVHLSLVSGFRTSRIIRILRDQDLLSENIFGENIRQLVGDHCMLVTSTIAGLGKSTYIENDIRTVRKNKTQIKLQISGDVSIDTLLERLRDKKIQLEPSTIALHINIGQVENIQQLNEFLYSLIVFRCFRFGQMPVDVPVDMPIYIELDSSLHLSNLKDQIIIFKYLKTKNIERLEWTELKIDSNEMEWIANYLQAIEDKTIDKKDIQKESIVTINDQSICINLLKKYFLPNKNLEFISWTQLSIFLSVYSKLFSDFSKCGYFTVNSQIPSSLRCDILISLLNSSDQFTSLSVETVRQNQRAVHKIENELPLNETILRWDKSQPFILIFTADNAPLFVYKSRDDIPQSLKDAIRSDYELKLSVTTPKTTNTSQQGYFSWFRKTSSTETTTTTSPNTVEQQLEEMLKDPSKMTHEQFFLQLTALSRKYFMRKSICLNCFDQFNYEADKCSSCETNNILLKPTSLDEKDLVEFQKQIAEKIQSTYVLTPDNYIKMLLIYLRVQSKLPVLIMGETGCGKTALIQCLCRKILDDDMEVFHIHAGVTNEKIIETMHDYIKKAKSCSQKKQNKRLWIFFDEFNTTPNIGLIKEIVCERTLLGESLPDNMVFLGACNPQRRKAKREESTEQFGIKKYHAELRRQIHGTQSSLLYSVVPIPETMLEHVWDYGFLDEATEKKYIEKILNACKDLTDDNGWFTCTADLISESQKYFRTMDDVSSVSLRDTVRFCRFYNWFYAFPTPSENQQALVLYPFTKIERASLLALLLCYYFRLDSAAKRKDYIAKITGLIQKLKPDISSDSINTLLQNEKMNLVNRMELPPGTAKNNALTDNIFVLSTCILNKIPVILCGEPGSSKTSAVQIIISNLKGKKSEDKFFKEQPELVAVSFQGSQNCTSESIIKVFERADKYANAKSEIQLSPVIVFDEIGLAELSPHNPLKVLHSQLEMEACRHGFVGLSNWRLDASKMNRAVYLSCPEPDLNDLKLTAISLWESMSSDGGQGVPIDQRIVESLAVAYMKLGEQMKRPGNRHYFGLRDYYSLIKGIMHDTVQKEYKKEYLYKIIRRQFACNFDDLTDGSKFIWSKFCEHMQEEYKVSQFPSPAFDQLLNQCLSSRNGRFLMLIGDSENTFDYLQRYITLKHPSIQTRTLIGSTFPGDFLSKTTYTEQYNIRVLMDIILDAERNVTLFLRGLGHLYDNLYDLFNQSFAVSAKKKYCRVALGSLYHPRCVIHDEFYCVVFVKEQDLDKYDLPFLNRFEKHRIDIDILIDEHHKNIASKLDQWINQLIATRSNANFPLKKHLFLEYSENYTLNLVIDAFNQLKQSNNSTDDKNVFDHCQNQLLRISSFDLPLLLACEKKTDQKQLIEQYYQTHNDLTFTSFINNEFEGKRNNKLLIYTYTQINHTIDYTGISKHTDWMEEIKLSYFKTELELLQKIKMHYSQTGSTRLLCIRIDYQRDHQHVPILKHILINEQVNDINRGVCLIFHLQRCEISQMNNDVFFDGWSRVMIDDLEKHQLLPERILVNPLYGDLIIYLDFLNMKNVFDDLINRCIIQFHYIVTNQNCETEINKHRNRIIEQLTLTSNESLRSLVKQCLTQWIQNIVPSPNQTQFSDWREDLLSNGIINGSARSFHDALIKTISLFLDKYLSLLFHYLEKHSLIDSYLFLIDSNKQTREKLTPIWNAFWKMTVEKIDLSTINENYTKTSLVLDLHLPCATKEYEIISQIRQLVAQNRPNNDKNLIDIAYNQLISKSFYGTYIEEIFQDSDMFNHYYHDQLTLTKNEANIHHLPTSLMQRLTSKLSDDIKYQLTYLLVYPEELFEIMRLFEISLPIISEKRLIEVIDQQYTFCTIENEDSSIKNNTNFYTLLRGKEKIYLIPPQSSLDDKYIFERDVDPFMEISLMNLIELLVSQPVLDSMNDINNLKLVFSLFSQSMTKLTRFGQHKVINFDKFISFLRLASCISTLFPSDKAMTILKEIHRYSKGCATFDTLEDIHTFIDYLRNVIHNKKSPESDTVINQILLKFENELVKNWSFDNSSKCSDILSFINNTDRWKYSAKIFNFINKTLDLSGMVIDNGGHIEQHEDGDPDLCLPDDQTRKMEILLTTQIYTQLVLDENYQPQIIAESNYDILTLLNENIENLKENISEINDKQEDHTLELIGLIAWLRYYLLYYAYALKKDIKDEIIEEIDKILVEYNLPFCSTMKLYIIKLLCSAENVTLTQLNEKYSNKNTVWIRQMISQSSNQRAPNARRSVMLPTPLFEFLNDFKHVDENLSRSMNDSEMKEFISQCSENQSRTYCVLMWFVHYYTRYYMSNVLPVDAFARLVEIDVAEKLKEWLGPIGHKFVYSLVKNFDEKSYFRLTPSMTEEDLHQRLLVLNLIAALLSFKATKKTSFFSSLLFNANLELPTNYTEHFNQLSNVRSIALANNLPLLQMINIRNQINKQPDANMNIFRCSSECRWIFCIENSTVANEHKECPLCKIKTCISPNGELLTSNRLHIPLTKTESLDFINSSIEDPLNDNRKPNHFMEFITQAIFLFLHELDFIPCSTTGIRSYFRKTLREKIISLGKNLANAEQSYIWLYKLIKHMVDTNLSNENNLQSSEKLLEEKLLIPHSRSIIDEIREYQSAYVDFVFGNEKNNQLVAFVDELIEDNNKYPLLNFFNITNIHSIDVIEHFYNQLQLQPNYETNYPITNFIFQRLSDYDNIQYLYPIIRFINYLMQQFDHRIKRADANKKTIAECLKNDPQLKPIFDEFVEAWRSVSLEEVSLEKKKYKFRSTQAEYNLENRTNISMFLLNKSNDNENMIAAACLQTIVGFQNDIFNYFHSNVIKSTEEHNYRAIPIQSIHQKHLFDFGTTKLRKLLVEKGLVINYMYGRSEEILYDYDEIEWILRNEINCLPKIDMDNIRYFNYQGELYDENMSLINEIRTRFAQKLLEDAKRTEIKKCLSLLDNNTLLEMSNSLEYILTYLREMNNRKIIETSTIQTFIDSYIQSKTYLNNLLSQQPFSSLSLEYIIDLYELVEEHVFDFIVRLDMRSELIEKSFSIEQINRQFIEMISNDEKLAKCFKEDLNIWINMFKRLLVRLLLTKMNINFDSPLQQYVRRSDMWKSNIKGDDLRTIEMKDSIRLKHAFVILKGLEAKLNEKTLIANQESSMKSEPEKKTDKNKTQSAAATGRSRNAGQRNRGPINRDDLR